MKIQVQVKRQGNPIAEVVDDVVQPGDLDKLVQRALEEARRMVGGQLWDAEISIKEAKS